MRTTSLLALSFLASLPAFAQLSPIGVGSFLVDGQVNLTSYRVEDTDDRLTIFTASPSAQFFVMPRFAVGGTLLLSHARQGDRASTTYGIGPALSYYFGPVQRTLYPFLSASYLYVSAPSSAQTTVRFSGGAALMIVKNVAITGEAYYQTQHDREDRDRFSSDQVGLAFGLAVFIY